MSFGSINSWYGGGGGGGDLGLTLCSKYSAVMTPRKEVTPITLPTSTYIIENKQRCFWQSNARPNHPEAHHTRGSRPGGPADGGKPQSSRAAAASSPATPPRALSSSAPDIAEPDSGRRQAADLHREKMSPVLTRGDVWRLTPLTRTFRSSKVPGFYNCWFQRCRREAEEAEYTCLSGASFEHLQQMFTGSAPEILDRRGNGEHLLPEKRLTQTLQERHSRERFIVHGCTRIA